MTPVQLRAKYELEQYVQVFTFPGNVEGFPVITVDVVLGVDPNAVTFAGWLSTWQNTVGVLILQGVPGCTYRISCTARVLGEIYTQSGLISVLPTAAALPPDSDAPPFTQIVTTFPYPYIYVESLGVGSSALPGTHKYILIPYDYTESLDILSETVNGVHRVLQQLYEYIEAVDVVGTAVDGVHRDLLLLYTLTEALNVSGISVNGVHRVYLLQYLYAEGLDVTSIALNGTHATI